jgi:cytochrome c oxidase subunit 4
MTEHVVSAKLYMVVFVLVVALMLVSVFLASAGMGQTYTFIALAIAACQAVLVILFFMHIRWSTRLIVLFAVGGFVWLAILIGFTLSDYLTRNWLPAPRGW